MKSILFYWSRGAEVRRKIVKLAAECEDRSKPCFINSIAKKIKLSHVAVKKHVDLLIEEGYLKEINPLGKPVFLTLTSSGKDAAKEFNRLH